MTATSPGRNDLCPCGSKKKYKQCCLLKETSATKGHPTDLVAEALMHHQAGRLQDAEALYRQALKIDLAHADALHLLGMLLYQRGQADTAIELIRKAIQHAPNHAFYYNNLCAVYQSVYRLEDAANSCLHALALEPNYVEAYNNLGNIYAYQGKIDEAMTCFRKALAIKPDYVEAHSNLICTLDQAANVDIPAMQAERKKWRDIHAAPFSSHHSVYANRVDPDRPLRIGYVSADFRRHSAAYAFSTMLSHFDAAQFQIFAYSNTQQEDEYSDFLRQRATSWRKILHLSDDAVAELIRQDAIDILVDLSGHSPGNRLLVFARKPAPLQITAWGYASSTGLQKIDVFFSDSVIIPEHERALYTEKIVYLPCMLNYFFPRPPPPVNDLPALTNSYITFGSFNRISKISKETFDSWTTILDRVSHSRFLFKSVELDDANVCQSILMRFMEKGIDSSRIVFLGKTSVQDHLAAYNQVDIALDPFPHGGGVTTFESVMMGIPVLTRSWPTIAGRVGASILTCLNLQDWIASSGADYIALATDKTRDVEALSTLRNQLRSRFKNSVVGNPSAYVAAVEKEYRQLWRDWCGAKNARPSE